MDKSIPPVNIARTWLRLKIRTQEFENPSIQNYGCYKKLPPKELQFQPIQSQILQKDDHFFGYFNHWCFPHRKIRFFSLSFLFRKAVIPTLRRMMIPTKKLFQDDERPIRIKVVFKTEMMSTQKCSLNSTSSSVNFAPQNCCSNNRKFFAN